jgi:hypothetical protein
MKNRGSSVENWTIGTLSVVALITFFFPLVSVHLLIARDMEFSGYDSVVKARQFWQPLELRDTSLQTADAQAPEGRETQRNPAPGSETPQPQTSPPTGPQIPLSVQLGGLIPLLIIGGYFFALLSFFGCFSSWPMTKLAATLGALCGFGAILHTLIINSQMHAMYEELMSATKSNLKDNPFAGFAEAMGKLMANAFQLKPGLGLYILTVGLGIAAFLAHSRVLSRVRIAPPSE